MLTNAIGPRRGELQVSRLNIKIPKSSSWTRYTHRFSTTLYDSLLSLVHFTRTTAPGPPQHHEIHLEDFILAIERDFFVVGIVLSQTALGDQQVQVSLTSSLCILVIQQILTRCSSSGYQILDCLKPLLRNCAVHLNQPLNHQVPFPSQNMALTTSEQLSKETADTTGKPQPVNHCPVIIDPEEPAEVSRHLTE